MLNEDAIVISFLRNDGFHVIILAVSYDNILAVFRSTKEGHVLLHARNDGTSNGVARAFISITTTFEAGIAAVMNQARTIIEQLPLLLILEEDPEPPKLVTNGELR